MSAVRFSKQYVQPKPHEVDYWVDLATNPYGAVIKYYNGDDWEQWEGSGGQSSNFDVYTKKQINEMLAKKANVGDVDSKVDDDELAEVIKNIKIKEIGNDGVALVLFKYDNTNLAITLPTATAANAGVLSGKDFANFVKQHQLQALYSEMYDLFAEIRSKYQRKLKAGRNIKITSDNVISAEINVGPGSYDAALNELDEKINTETERAIAVEDRLEKRVDQHYVETDNLFVLKANKADVYTKSQVNDKLTGVYKVKGSKTYEKLPTSNSVGDVYNITNQFTLNGTTYPAGTNVVYTEYGWDALSGNFDVTTLEEDIQTVADDLSKETLRAIKAETYNSNSIINLTNAAAELTTKLNTLTGNVYTVAQVDDIVDGYLPLSGGTLTGNLTLQYANPRIVLKDAEGTTLGAFGLNNNILSYYKTADTKWYTIYHSGNFTPSNYLPLTGGTLNGQLILDHDYGSNNANIVFKNNRLSSAQTSNSADNVILIKDVTDATVCRFGVYGIMGITSYMYLGLNQYNGNNLRVYSDKVTFGDSQLAYLTSNVASATKLATARTIWGQSFDGTGDISGNVIIDNNRGVNIKDTGGTSRTALFVSDRNNLHLGYGPSGAGYNTYIDGNNIYLRYGTSNTTGLTLNSSGQLIIAKDVHMSNNMSIGFKDTEGTVRNSIYLSQANNLNIGYATSAAGYKTNLYGNTIEFRYGTSHTLGIELTSAGRVSIKGNVDIPNNKSIYFKNSSGTDINSLYLDNSNILHLGYGTSGSYNTKIYGNNLYLCYGSRSVGMVLNSSGNITIGSSDLAGAAYKMCVDGSIQTTGRANIGGALTSLGNYTKYNSDKSYRLMLTHDGNEARLYNIIDDTSVYGNIRIGTTNSNCIFFDGVNYRLGIKTTAPAYTLDVNGVINTNSSIYAQTTSNTSIQVKVSNDIASMSLYVSANGAKGLYDTVNGKWIVYTNATNTFLPTGNVGIGTASPSAKLHVNGNILATGTIGQESQRDLKNIIDEKILSLDDMNTINPTRFTWKDNRDEDIHYGGIAEDIQQVIPEVVHKSGDNLTVEYANAAFAMVTSLVKHVKDLEQRLSKLEEDYKQLLLNNKQ